MSKAKATREHILHQAAELFNQQGVAGSSIADIMKATGLQKGGIYNHFKSKEELAGEAFEYALRHASEQLVAAVKSKRHAKERLQTLTSIYFSFIEDPPLAGGCPLLNHAVESDDAHPALRLRVQQAMDRWRQLIVRIVVKGISRGEISPDTDPEEVATLTIATLEGAIMLSKLYGDPIHLRRAIAHLNRYYIAVL